MFSRRGRSPLVLLVPGLISAAPASHRAAPEIIILHGGILATPIFITDRRETAAFDVSQSAAVSPHDLTGRPHFDAALFWGPLWARYARDSVKVRTLDPNQADQHGRIYLPRRMAEAPVFVFQQGAPDARRTRRISPDGMRLLQLHRVPVYIGSTSELHRR